MASSKRLLLDTNVLLWSALQPEKLSSVARGALTDLNAQRFVSVVSVWEMQIKHANGKLPLVQSADAAARRYVAELNAEFLNIELEHIAALYQLPNIHRDPFDRMLMAQALSEGLAILSPDETLHKYPVQVTW